MATFVRVARTGRETGTLTCAYAIIHVLLLLRDAGEGGRGRRGKGPGERVDRGGDGADGSDEAAGAIIIYPHLHPATLSMQDPSPLHLPSSTEILLRGALCLLLPHVT